MQVRRVFPALVCGVALFALVGCGTTNPVANTSGALDTTPPAAPQNLKTGLDDGGGLLLTWDASSDADVAGYNVYRYSPDPSRENAYVQINGALVTTTSYEVSDATPDGSYYRVKAIDRSSNVSSSSSTVDGASGTPASGGTDVTGDPGIRRLGH
jgi:hypothetical protein